MNKIKLLCLTLLLPINSYAIDYSDLPAYEIEVVIFKYADSRSAGSEIWPDLVKTVPVDNSVQLHNSSSLTQIPGPDFKGYYYSRIENENLKLLNQAEKLRSSNQYQILYHSGWIQPGLDKESAEPIQIKTTDVDSKISFFDSLTPLTIEQPDNTINPLIISNGDNKEIKNTILEGLVTVELGRYLHINFDLKYQRDLAPIQGIMHDTAASKYKELKYYPIQTHRRMRSNEVHYIDHPLIGILVLATRFKLPEVEGDQEFVNSPLIKLNDAPVDQ